MTQQKKTKKNIRIRYPVWRALTGAAALALLVIAAWLYLFTPTRENDSLALEVCMRLGPVLLMTWLAWQYIELLPLWAFAGVWIILVAALIHRRLIPLAIPVAILIAILNRPVRRKKK